MTVDALIEHARIAAFALPLVLIAFALHEMAHAWVATWFGDPTPAAFGRRTLNPIRHLDPVGTIMLVASMLLLGVPFGFAVTPVDEGRMRRPRLHGALTSLAGPMVNIVLCGASMVLLLVTSRELGPEAAGLPLRDLPITVQAAYWSMTFNAFLAVFNLLPIPPLDGGHILGSFMRDDLRREWRKLDQYGILIILGIALLGGGSFSAFLGSLQEVLLGLVGILVGSTGIGV